MSSLLLYYSLFLCTLFSEGVGVCDEERGLENAETCCESVCSFPSLSFYTLPENSTPFHKHPSTTATNGYINALGLGL